MSPLSHRDRRPWTLYLRIATELAWIQLQDLTFTATLLFDLRTELFYFFKRFLTFFNVWDLRICLMTWFDIVFAYCYWTCVNPTSRFNVYCNIGIWFAYWTLLLFKRFLTFFNVWDLRICLMTWFDIVFAYCYWTCINPTSRFTVYCNVDIYSYIQLYSLDIVLSYLHINELNLLRRHT